jgi:hypothetical protein
MSAGIWFRPAVGILTAVAIASAPLAAQESRVFVSTGGQLTAGGNLPISDAAVQAIVGAHFPEALGAGAEANALTLVVDANGNYVSGKASKATIITRTSSEGGPAAIDTTIGGAHVMMRRSDDGSASASAAAVAGAVVVARSSSEGGAAMVGAKSGTGGIMGTDIPMSSVGAIGMRHYAAGELGSDPLMVTVIKLK